MHMQRNNKIKRLLITSRTMQKDNWDAVKDLNRDVEKNIWKWLQVGLFFDYLINLN